MQNKIHPADAYAGERLRQGRLLRDLSQAALGAALSSPITFQQIQKYESGTNRISVSRLCEFCEVLRLPCSFFMLNSDVAPLPILSAQEANLLALYKQTTPEAQNALHALLNAMGGM